MSIWSKLNREWAGATAITVTLWGPLWLIAGVYLFGGHNAVIVCSVIGLAPYGIGLIVGALVLFGSLVLAINSAENFALAVVFGVPALLWLFGPVYGLAVIAASVAWWIVGRWMLRRLEKRSLVR